MKKRILFIFLIFYCAVISSGAEYKPVEIKSFKELWNLVEKNEKEGRPKTLLKIADTLLKKAQTEKNETEVLKALILIKQLKEDYYAEDLIAQFEQVTNASSGVLKHVLQSILADIYWYYYDYNSYRIGSDTDDSSVEFEKWSKKKFISKVNELLLSSVDDHDLLEGVPTDYFQGVIVVPVETKHKISSLYDFLMYKAVDFWSDKDVVAQESAEPFITNDAILSESSARFVNLKDFAPMTFTGQAFRALQVLEKSYSENPSLQAAAMLRRINLAYYNSTEKVSDGIYISALEKMSEKYRNSSIYPEIRYYLAKYYYEAGSEWNYDDIKEGEFYIKKSFDICEDVLSNCKSSPGLELCANLKAKILHPFLEVKMEAVEIANRPMKALIRFKNISKVHFSILNRPNTVSDLDDYYSLSSRYVMYYGLVKRWSQDLPEKNDFRTHSVEVVIPPMSTGEYVLTSSVNPEFSILNDDQNVFSSLQFTISDFYLHEDSTALYILDRNSGYPVSDLKVDIDRYFFVNRITRSWETVNETVTTDANGKILNPHGYLSLAFSGKGETVRKKSYPHYGSVRKTEKRTFFFTDRGLYRPGQTVFFKGLVVRFDEYGVPSVVSNENVDIEFKARYGANIGKTSFSTNEYGSFSGSFKIPESEHEEVTITDGYNEISVSVQEYKRPSFEVKVENVGTSVRMNDKVTVKGNVRSFAGANLTDAFVKYSYCGNSRISANEDVVKLNKKGEFVFSFKVKPKDSYNSGIDEKCNVEVKVTDISGETRFAYMSFIISDISVLADSDVSETEDLNTFKSVKIDLKTPNGDTTAVRGTLRIYKMQDPDRLVRYRLWDAPDTFIMKEKEFIDKFPFDGYDSEKKIIKKTVFDKKIDTAGNPVIRLGDNGSWEDGEYRLELNAIDVKGGQIKYVKDFYIIKAEDGSFEPGVYFKIFQLTESALPGEDAKILLASGAENMRVILKFFNSYGEKEERIVILNRNRTIISIPVTEKDRGGFSFTAFVMKNNRIFWKSGRFDVPWTDKELDVSLINLKNVIEPGAYETLKMKVINKNGKKVPSEMLAVMYDASLDEIEPFSWTGAFWPFFEDYKNRRPVMEYSEAEIAFGDEPEIKSACGSFINYLRYPEDGECCKPQNDTDFRRIYLDRDTLENNLPEEDNQNVRNKKYREKTVIDFEDVMLEGQIKKPAGHFLISDRGSVDFIGKKESSEKDLSSGNTLNPQVQTRKNMIETAFFIPAAEFNSDGEVNIPLKVPDSLTRWKIMGFVHSRDMLYSIFKTEVIAQKHIMVSPNVPRFLRSGDKVVINAKITNITGVELKGEAKLELLNSATDGSVDDAFGNTSKTVWVSIPAKGNINVSWPLNVSGKYKSVKWRVSVVSGNKGDRVENVLDILPQKILVTESQPVFINADEKEVVRFENLIKNVAKAGTDNLDITLELTTDPFWSVVTALPFLIEFPYECSEQLFNRLYANLIISHLLSDPAINSRLKKWNPDYINKISEKLDAAEFPGIGSSSLRTDSEQKLRPFSDQTTLDKMEKEILQKMTDRQSWSGGFPWFEGLDTDRFISQYIASGFGKLQKILGKTRLSLWDEMIQRLIRHIDSEITVSYKKLKEKSGGKDDRKVVREIDFHYFYARSFFADQAISAENIEAFNFYKKQISTYWHDESPYIKALAALALNRFKETETAQKIMTSLNEYAVIDNKEGMHFKVCEGTKNISVHAVILEAYEEIKGDGKAVSLMKKWLIRQKSRHDWGSTIATSDVIYSLLAGMKMPSDTFSKTEIILNDTKLEISDIEKNTGYVRRSWKSSEITPGLGEMTVFNYKSTWGGLYWSHYENIDEISQTGNMIKVTRKILKEKYHKGITIREEIPKDTVIPVGTRLIILINVNASMDMEYVHIEDSRPGGTEPEYSQSQRYYSDKTGSYYETVSDVSNNIFIEYLQKGSVQFEIPVLATVPGNFSSGYTHVESMYSPEYSAYSSGGRIIVK